MEQIKNNFVSFIDKTPNPYYCIDNLRKMLESNGFKELHENKSWDLKEGGKYFIIRDDLSVVAFIIGQDNTNTVGFNIVKTHINSPFLRINREDFRGESFITLSPTNNSNKTPLWLDKPLSIAGKVVIERNDTSESLLIDVNKELLIIPGETYRVNREKIKDDEPHIKLHVKGKIEDNIRIILNSKGKGFCSIRDYHLYPYIMECAKIVGTRDGLIQSSRLDSLASIFPTVCAFIDSSNNNSTNVFCALNSQDNEQNMKFLYDVLSRMSTTMQHDFNSVLANSFIINANQTEITDSSKSLNQGITVRNNPLDSDASSTFEEICKNASVPFKESEGTTSKSTDKISVDVELPQLLGTVGKEDIYNMYKSILEFYNSTIIKESGKMKILDK